MTESANLTEPTNGLSLKNELLFAQICDDLVSKGFSVQANAVPKSLSKVVYEEQQQLTQHEFLRAGIGRKQQFNKNEHVRSDAICWLIGQSNASQRWLDWTSQLQNYLNKNLFLGLFSFESHYAHYAPGDCYKKHFDAFRGQANRVLSVITYLNPEWSSDDGGELILYEDKNDPVGQTIQPLYGTLVVFLSEQFPHEVLPAKKDRFSIAGWFRVNTSSGQRVDPPQ